jgi:hypothetical protein
LKETLESPRSPFFAERDGRRLRREGGKERNFFVIQL